ncbi:YcaO-like family protein [Streptococcus sobrinus]|uniref:YcaO-like family protein n=1 Tax=Streptococcus sobrinus TaxID=1310 RepID=UPI0002E4897E|nr:YcaO-like family protein [Streptococcus sobrinus]
MKTVKVIPPMGIQQTSIYITEVGDLKRLYDVKSQRQKEIISGAGTHKNSLRAQELSNFEALERIANSINCRDVIVGTLSDMKDKAVKLSSFPKIDSRESGEIFKMDTIYSWVEVYDLLNDCKKLIPQNYIYLYSDNEFKGDLTVAPISTGAALHDDYLSAIINGIYEVFERDSISLTWLLKDINSEITDLYDSSQKVFDNSFLGQVRYYDVSKIDGVYTICAHAKSNFSSKCKNALMFCTSTNLYEIRNKLNKELISVMFSFYSSKKDYTQNTDYTKFTDVDESGFYMARDFNDKHFYFFDLVSHKSKIEDFKKHKFMSKTEELNYLLKIIKSNHWSIYVADISSREVLEANTRAVKVVIPELMPISFIYGRKYLGTNRFVRLAKELYGKDYHRKVNDSPLAFS